MLFLLVVGVPLSCIVGGDKGFPIAALIFFGLIGGLCIYGGVAPDPDAGLGTRLLRLLFGAISLACGWSVLADLLKEHAR